VHSAFAIFDEIVYRFLDDIVYVELRLVVHLSEKIADHGQTHDPKAYPANLLGQIRHLLLG
jgi:hypothetical protein